MPGSEAWWGWLAAFVFTFLSMGWFLWLAGHRIEGLLALLDCVRDDRDRLRDAIRQHRDERGDDRCHADDGRLYAVLPEGDTRPKRETLVTLENCARFIGCRQTGREYVSPQRRIEELEAEVAALRAKEQR